MLRGPRPLGSNIASTNTLPKKALDFGNSGSFPNPTSHKGASLGSIFAGQQANLQTSLSSNSPLGEEAQEIRPLPFANKGVGVVFIFSSKLGGITKEILPQFQWLCWIKSLRRRAFSPLLRSLTMRLLKGPSLIHLSNQRDKQLIPFLILVAIHLIPFLITSSPNRADQVVEQILDLEWRFLLRFKCLWEKDTNP